MKTTTAVLPRAAKLAVVCFTAAVLVTLQARAFPILTNVVETGGDNEATDTITAKWTGVTWNTTMANEPTLATPIGTPFTVPKFGEDVPSMVDRAHQYNGATTALPLPGYLVGGEYIMIGNDNRDNPAPFQLDLYLAQRAVVFVLVDSRNGDVAQGGTASNGNPPFLGAPLDQWAAMTWLNTLGFQPVTNGLNRSARLDWPDEIGWDEVGTAGIGPGVEIQQYGGIYYKVVDPGAPGTPAISLYESAAAGQNMYGVAVTAVAPAVPTGLSTISMNGRLGLNWSASQGARSYIIKRSDVSGGPYSPVATNATTSYVDPGLVNFQNYYYVVSALGLFGESANSAQAVGTPKLAPENLVAVGGTNQVGLSWTALTGAASYTVKRADVSGGPYSELVTGFTGTSYVDTGLPAGRRYYYTVSAPLTGGGESANADEAFAFTAPNVPANFVAERFAATVIRLSWTNVDQLPATTTTLVEKSSNGTTFTQVAAVAAGGRRYHDVGLAANVTNYYRVRATNSGGFSAYTAAPSANTPASGINVNFANTNFTTGVSDYPIPGYLDDYGFVYADRGNGYSYGWDDDNTQHARRRNSANSPDRRYDTFNHLQKTDPLPAARMWEIAIANGLYLAHIVSGDATATDSVFQWDVEGYISQALTPAANNWWREFNLTVKVQDGRMTFNNGPSASNNKIAFVDIYPTVPMSNSITAHPVSLTVTQNQSATFSVAVGGGPEPYGFQWRFKGNPIASANAATYTIPLVQLSDAGDYSVAVTNAGASVVSSNATLTVIQDIWPPTMLSAGSVDGNTIGVCFNEPVDLSTAGDPGAYRINGAAGSVNYVVLWDDLRTAQLYPTTPVAANFTLTVNNVKDLAGNPRPTATVNGVFMGLTPVDLAFPGLPGESFTCDGINLRMIGGGADIWGAYDQGHYASKTVSGDFDARVRVASLTQANVWSKAGIMVREDQDAAGRNVTLVTAPLPLNNLYQTQWRDAVGGASAAGPTTGPVSYPDAWIRLARYGNTFTSLIKTNGTDWVVTQTYTPASSYPSQVYVGLAVTAHDNALTATGMFSGFNLTAPLSDVSVRKTAASNVVAQGGTITYTLTAANQAPVPATTVVVTDPLPAGVAYVGSVATVGSASHAAGTVTWNVGTLTNGQSATLTFTATATTGGSKVNTATVTSGSTDENPANNSASVTVNVSAPPAPPTLINPAFAAAKFTFSLATETGRSYVVEYTDSLSTVDWKVLATIPGNGTVVPVEDAAPPQGERYYRVRVVSL